MPKNLQFETIADTAGVIEVESGLFPSDLIVFMGYLGLSDRPKRSFHESYLVTRVNPDGSGVMIADSLAAKDPRQALSDSFRQHGLAVLAAEYTFGDFDAGWLDTELLEG